MFAGAVSDSCASSLRRASFSTVSCSASAEIKSEGITTDFCLFFNDAKIINKKIEMELFLFLELIKPRKRLKSNSSSSVFLNRKPDVDISLHVRWEKMNTKC